METQIIASLFQAASGDLGYIAGQAALNLAVIAGGLKVGLKGLENRVGRIEDKVDDLATKGGERGERLARLEGQQSD